MDPQWDDNQPIYRQLRDRVVAMILEGVLKEGDPLPRGGGGESRCARMVFSTAGRA
jgi:GntR family transcriptional regulator